MDSIQPNKIKSLGVVNKLVKLGSSIGSLLTFLADRNSVAAFYPKFRKINWDKMLAKKKQIDIVVCYFDSWVNKDAHDAIVKFFTNSGSIKLILPNPESDRVLEITRERYPEYTVEKLKNKIQKTVLGFQAALKMSNSKSAGLEIYYFPHTLNYMAMRLDNSQVLLSTYEQFRDKRVDASAVLLNIKNSIELKQYWDKEFSGFFEKSKLQQF